MAKKSKNFIGFKKGKLTVLNELEKNKHNHRVFLIKCECGVEKAMDYSVLMRDRTTSCGCAKNFRRTKYDLTNEKFGFLTCIDSFKKEGKAGTYWNCVCDCGNKKSISSGDLVNGNTISCGCWWKSFNTRTKTKDLVGKRFGKLLVIKRTEAIKDKRFYWTCQCDCGNIKDIAPSSLVRGLTNSCGCNQQTRITINRGELNLEYSKNKFRVYKNKCKKRNMDFNLTFEEFYEFLQKSCVYCGRNELITLDRVNNFEGYNKNNTVSCCLSCNVSKGTQTLDEFLNYLNIFYSMTESPLKLKEKIMKKLDIPIITDNSIETIDKLSKET